MSTRDLALLVTSTAAGIAGIILTLVWSVEAGLVVLFVLILGLMGLLFLQRRQLAKLQQRTLLMLNRQQEMISMKASTSAVVTKSSESIAVPTKKIIGLLQAQQVSMEILDAKLERALGNETDDETVF